VIYAAGMSENNRLGNGGGSDARMHSSLAVENSRNSLSTAYKDVSLSGIKIKFSDLGSIWGSYSLI